MNPPARTPALSPGIYEHAAGLVGETPARVSRDGALLFEAHKAAWDIYQHPHVVAGIDVYNVEPEALGAELDAPVGNGVPSVISHPVPSLEALLDIGAPDPARAGRMPVVIEAARKLAGHCRGAGVFVPVCGPLALANGLVGMDEVLCMMVEDPDLVAAALLHLADLQGHYVRSILGSGLRPMIFESGASPPLLPHALFSTIEAPALGRLFSICRLSGDDAPHCILGGDVVPVLADLLALDPGFLICPAETDQSAFVELAAAAPHIAVRVNMPVGALLTTDWEETRRAADLARSLAARLPNSTVGTGVVPVNARPDLIVQLRNYIQHL